jgi:hypothetical protein
MKGLLKKVATNVIQGRPSDIFATTIQVAPNHGGSSTYEFGDRDSSFRMKHC